MAYLDDLIATRDAIAALRREVFENREAKPTYNVEGNSYAWNEYWKMWGEELEKINRAIPQSDPCEIVSQG